MLKSCIADNFDEAMQSYVASDEYTELAGKADETENELRKTLNKEQEKLLDNCIAAVTEKFAALSENAYIKGTVDGINLNNEYGK